MAEEPRENPMLDQIQSDEGVAGTRARKEAHRASEQVPHSLRGLKVAHETSPSRSRAGRKADGEKLTSPTAGRKAGVEGSNPHDRTSEGREKAGLENTVDPREVSPEEKRQFNDFDFLSPQGEE